jgi:hypothetical protein
MSLGLEANAKSCENVGAAKDPTGGGSQPRRGILYQRNERIVDWWIYSIGLTVPKVARIERFDANRIEWRRGC